MTHSSLEEALDHHPPIKLNPRIPNPRESLDNKVSSECHRNGIMETMSLPMDIHETSILELETEDDINEHESYFINIPLSTKYGRQSTEEGTHDGRLVGGGARDDELDIDARQT
jgi:hypothetical protein